MTTTTFRFDRDYKNYEQVAEFTDAYMAVYEELEAAGKYPFNDSFKGRIPGIEGPDEDTAIYLLQGTRSRAEHQAKVDAARADGFEPITAADVSAETRFAVIVDHGFYMGGTGWLEYHDARLIPHHGGLAVLPKGRRTNGHHISGQVLVKRKGKGT